MRHGADMVLVAVGHHQPDQIVPMLGDEARVGHHDIDAGHRVVAEGHAEIDHQPLAVIAVEIEIHADLAGAAERQEQELAVAPDRRVEPVFGHARLRS